MKLIDIDHRKEVLKFVKGDIDAAQNLFDFCTTYCDTLENLLVQHLNDRKYTELKEVMLRYVACLNLFHMPEQAQKFLRLYHELDESQDFNDIVQKIEGIVTELEENPPFR